MTIFVTSYVVLTPLACTGNEGCRKYVQLHSLCQRFIIIIKRKFANAVFNLCGILQFINAYNVIIIMESSLDIIF